MRVMRRRMTLTDNDNDNDNYNDKDNDNENDNYKDNDKGNGKDNDNSDRQEDDVGRPFSRRESISMIRMIRTVAMRVMTNAMTTRMTTTMTTRMTLVDLSPHVSRFLQTSPHLQSNKLVASQRVQHTEHDVEEEESENTDVQWMDETILNRDDYYTAAIFLWPDDMSSLGWW